MYRNIQTDKIRVAIVGLENCASSLIQGIHYYSNRPAEVCIGVLHYHVGPYGIADIIVVAAFDIDSRKVGKDVNEAIFEAPGWP
jgi:myo-inositol-1-phosphate synthase